MVIIAVSSFLKSADHPLDLAFEQNKNGLHRTEAKSIAKTDRILSQNSTSAKIAPSQPIISRKGDEMRVHSLQTDHVSNSIILQRHTTGETNVQKASLARIPDSETLQNSMPTLIDTAAADQRLLQLVLNQAPQPSYSLDPNPDVSLPLVITREKASINVETDRLPYRINGHGKRLRDEACEEGGHAGKHSKIGGGLEAEETSRTSDAGR